MAKTKIISSGWNETEKIAAVTIQNCYGVFTGVAKCMEEDLEYCSQFAGIELAETKAFQKYYSKRVKIALKKATDIRKLIDEISNFANQETLDYLSGRYTCAIDEAIMWAAKGEMKQNCWELTEKARREKVKQIRERRKGKSAAEIVEQKLKDAFDKLYGEDLDKNVKE